MSDLPISSNPLGGFQSATTSQPTKRNLASLPVARPTQTFWQTDQNIFPSPTHGREGPLTTDADICIIGSGMTGVSAAYHLAKHFAQKTPSHPIKVLILEAREFCSGATGRNGGHLSANVYEGFNHQQSLYGKDEALRGFALEEYSVSEIIKVIHDYGKEDQVDFVSGGLVELFLTDEELEEFKRDYEAAKATSINLEGFEWLTKEEVREQYGAHFPGLRRPGNNLWPLKLVAFLYELAGKLSDHLSVTLNTYTPVTSVTPIQDSDTGGSSKRRWSLQTSRGSIACSYVLHATNAYVSHLIPQYQGPNGVIPTRGQVIALRANASSNSITKSAWAANEGFEYWFPRPTRSPDEKPLIIIGGARDVTKPHYELYEDDDSTLNQDVSRALREFLPRVFPDRYENGREPEMEWSGIMGFTKTGDPIVGPVIDLLDKSSEKFKGQYVSAGYSGHGMPRAYACAEVVASMIAADMSVSEMVARNLD